MIVTLAPPSAALIALAKAPEPLPIMATCNCSGWMSFDEQQLFVDIFYSS
ncbi:hypothetical protein [uncultured Flavobacterium sp.]